MSLKERERKEVGGEKVERGTDRGREGESERKGKRGGIKR